MFTREAANALVTSNKTLTPLDPYDVTVIQYKTAIYKCQEILRRLETLEKNLRNGTKDNVIPLLNYTVLLTEDPTFNVHPMLRRRLDLLSDLKLCKTTEVNPPPVTDPVDPTLELGGIVDTKEYGRYKQNIYDLEFQWKLFSCLRRLSQNTHTIYSKKLRQLQLEKNSTIKRPYEVSEFKNKNLLYPQFSINSVEDLLRPREMDLVLDLAVLINDRERDTTDRAFIKLQYQVMNKLVSHVNKRVYGPMKTLYIQLRKYSDARAANVGGRTNLKDYMSHPDFPLHRIYSSLWRIYTVLSVILVFARQFFTLNREFFTKDKTKLSSRNIYVYEGLLQRLEKICSPSGNDILLGLASHLKIYATKVTSYKLNNDSSNTDTITDLFNVDVSRFLKTLKVNLNLLTEWLDAWKYLIENYDLRSKFDDMTEEQLLKALDEKRSVDKLSYIENSNGKLKVPDVASYTSPPISSLSRMSSTASSSADVSPVLAALVLNDNEILPLDPNMKKAQPGKLHSTQHGSGSPGFQLMYPTPNTYVSGNRRLSLDASAKRSLNRIPSPYGKGGSPLHTPENLSSSNSPRISRRTSLIGRPGTNNSFLTPVNSSTGTSPVSLYKSAAAKAMPGRPRSQSLQAPVTGQSATIPISPPSLKVQRGTLARSNSLEMNAAIARKTMQDTLKKKGMRQSTTLNNLSRYSSAPTYRRNTIQGKNSINGGLPKNNSSDINNYLSGGIVGPNNGPSTSLLSGAAGGNTSQQPPKLNIERVDEFDVQDTTEKFASDSESQTLRFAAEDSGNEDGYISTAESLPTTFKKVRFIGVPPMTDAENPKPKRTGWYKKPAVLHYPPPPPQVTSLRLRMRQEGIAFRTSLRENNAEMADGLGSKLDGSGNNSSSGRPARSGLFRGLGADEDGRSTRGSVGHRFASRIRDKLRS